MLALPDDVDALKAMVRSAQAALAARESDLRHRDLLIETLRHQLAGLRRQRYRVSAESLDQLELALEDEELARATVTDTVPRAAKSTPRHRALPGHLPREETVLDPEAHCADCGGALKRLKRLRPYLEHGFLELEINAAERALRSFVLGRKNYLFTGSPIGGKAAAVAYTSIETAKLNGLDPQAWLADVLRRILEHPSNRIDELLPWNCKPDKALSKAA